MKLIFNFASFFDTSRPIPPEPPVTTATLPLNVSFIALKYKKLIDLIS